MTQVGAGGRRPDAIACGASLTPSGNVTPGQHHGRDNYIVGPAHNSQRSVEEVRRVITEVKPDTVCVELDKTRFEALVDESSWRRLDVFQIIRDKKVLLLLANLALSGFQRRLGEKLGVRPGAELLAAVEAAEQAGAELVLADRDVQATLKRAWHNLSFWNKLRLSSVLLAAPFATEELSEEQVESLKERDTISEALAEAARHLPGIREPMIDERDRYLMSMVQEAPGKTIVAVVGAGHVAGMLANLGQSVDREALSEIPPPSLSSKALKWLLPAVVLSAFYYGYTQLPFDDFRRMLYAWVLPNSIFAALLTLLGKPKPLTLLTAFVASPITSLNPTIGAGMVAGLVEAWLRRPTVTDCENVRQDAMTLRGIYANRITRVLLIAVLATVGSALGAWVGGAWVLTLL